MPASNPPEAQPTVSRTPDGLVIDLPPRRLGKMRSTAVPIILFGLFFLVGVLSFFIPIAAASSDGGRAMPVAMRIAFCAFGLLFVTPSLLPIGIGLAILFGRSSIELTSRRVRRIERVGPFWWSRRKRTSGIRRFIVMEGSDRSAGGGIAANLAAIRVEFDTAKKWLILAPGYPPAMLTGVAEALAERWNKIAPAGPRSQAGPKVDAVVEKVAFNAPATAAGDQPVPDQPTGSTVTVEQTPDGVVLNIPPSGLWRGSAGMFGFSLVWNALVVPILAIALFSEPKSYAIYLLAGVFLIPGIAMLAVALRMGLRRTRIETASDAVRITTSDPFGTRTREWPYGAVAAIRAGPSGMKSNDVDIEELQFHPAQGKKAGFLAGRNGEELRWMATLLREQTGLPSHPKTEATAAAT